jgi:hypothetical protein
LDHLDQRRQHSALFGIGCVLLLLSLSASPVFSGDQLEDLTSGVEPVATLIERDNFANEFRYDVTVRNRSSRSVRTDSLIVVLDQITDIAGKNAMDRIEVVDADGQTQDGKPFYKVPAAGKAQLAPYTESEPVVVRLRNPYYTILFTPYFRVLGQQIQDPSPLLPAAGPPPVRTESDSVKRLVEILIKKGLLTEEEWNGGR